MCIAQHRPTAARQPALHPQDVAPQKPAKGITAEDVERVQVLIETCLVRQMSCAQTCDTLALMGVDPRFTKLVWARLEAENREFFQEYYKSQIAAMEASLRAMDVNAS